jgi:hypothetical protein
MKGELRERLSFRKPDHSLSEIALLVLGLKGRSPCRAGYTLFFVPPSFLLNLTKRGSCPLILSWL